MLVLPITYEDLDGKVQTKTFHFNITKAEIAELELSKLDLKTDGFQDHLTKIIAARSGREIIEAIKAVILMTIGERRGDLFVKNEEISDNFRFGGAYSALFSDLISDPEFAAAFVRGIVPASMSGEVQAKFEAQKIGTTVTGIQNDPAVEVKVAEPVDNRPPWIRENRQPTRRELDLMTREQLQEVMRRDFGPPVGSIPSLEGGDTNESS